MRKKYILFDIITILVLRGCFFSNIKIDNTNDIINDIHHKIDDINKKISGTINGNIIRDQEILNVYNMLLREQPIKTNTDKTRIPIFFANNNNNVHGLSVTIISIIENTDSFCEFYILEYDVTDNFKRELEKIKDKYNNFSIEWIKVNPQEIFKDLVVTAASGRNYGWVSYYDVYTRFLIPTVKPQIDKAIYLDYDVVVMGDIKSLFEQELGDYVIGGVEEKFQNKIALLESFNVSGTHKYFGSGILLMDCKGLRNDDFLDKILEIGVKYRRKLEYPDQDLLNIYFSVNNYKQLDYKFGVLNTTTNEEVIIQHFNGLKPWNGRHLRKEFYSYSWDTWWYYAVKSPFYNKIRENFEIKNI